jgi:hypothetical protein
MVETAVIGERLADATLARARQLPRRVAPVTLAGALVRLEPLDAERDADALFAVSNGQPIRLGEREVGPYDPDELI